MGRNNSFLCVFVKFSSAGLHASIGSLFVVMTSLAVMLVTKARDWDTPGSVQQLAAKSSTP